MFRKLHFFLSILLLSSIFCFTHTFADENGEPIDIENIIAEGNFDFPTPDGAVYIQGDTEYQRIPDVIIGDPDFEKMRDLDPESQDYQLGRKVGMIVTLNRTRDDLYFCTGFLVGPDLFMTNHHCIHDEQGLLPLGSATGIFMDYYQDGEDDDTLGGITARVSEVVRADAEKDYALLRLDTAIGDTYGWLELDPTIGADASRSVKLISHPQARSKEIVRHNSEILPITLDDFPHILFYLADTERGSSGAPVFLQDGTGVIAIHHSGITDRQTGEPLANAGSLMSHIVPEIQQYLPAVVEEPVYMYWTDSGTDTIQRADLNGSNIEDIVTTGLRTPTNVVVDLAVGKLWWTDSGTDTIQRANLDGSNVEDIVTTGLRTPTGIAVDREWGSVYWIDSGTDKIQRAFIVDGSNPQDVITTGLRTPTDIALDPYDPDLGKMYWTDSGTDKIQRANFNGSNIEDLITEGLRTPTSIALDLVAGKMYWTDSGTDKIQRANLDGSNIEDLVTTGLRTPKGIAVDPEAGKVYWIDSGTDKIQRANLDGSNIEDLVTTGLGTPTGIALGIPQIFSANPPPDPPPGPGPGPDPGSVDVDGDGQVTVIDLAIVALFYGTRVPAGLSIPADVNDDGTVNLSDLIAVAEAIDAAGNAGTLAADDVAVVLEAVAEQANEIEGVAEAPAHFSTSQQTLFSGIAYRNVAAAFADAKHLATDDVRLEKWTPLLKELLHQLAEMQEIPDTTALLPNYPNPFNPETWIPYHLATDAEVVLTIHDINGNAVRALTLGHQSAGIYESRGRAAYWDGRNESGEPVASGLYFYTLTAGEFTATRKFLIVK